ncbi:hypothetical protein ACU5EM_16180 [Aliivibrio wodanis]
MRWSININTGFFVVQLFRLLIICLCFGVSSLAQASAYHQNDDNHFVELTIEQHSTVPVTISVDNSHIQSIDFVTCNINSAQTDSTTLHSKSASQSHDVNLGLAYSSRMANLARHEPEEVFPVYELALEIPAIPSEQLTIGYQEKPKPAVNWALNTYSSTSRISAWKESNLLYSQRLYPHS